MLVDRFQRTISYIRVSITDKCNLRCIYCSPKPFLLKPYSEILTYDEILKILSVGGQMGISKVRITGGEPLLRKGIIQFLERLSSIKSIKNITLTTNGLLLFSMAEHLWKVGLRKLNISMDTLNKDKFKAITGINGLKTVKIGIKKALEVGFNPIKINVVSLKGINDEELENFVFLTRDKRLIVRFIEVMPLGIDKKWAENRFISGLEIKKRLSQRFKLIPIGSSPDQGPATYYQVADNNLGIIGFISPFSQCFCDKCNRIRLTSDGYLKPCLWSKVKINLRPLLESNNWKQLIEDAFQQAVNLKQKQFDTRYCNQLNMAQIGG